MVATRLRNMCEYTLGHLYIYYYSCVHAIFINYLTYHCLFYVVFGCMVIRNTYACTYLISFVSAPSPLHFRFESAVRYIRFWIRIRSLFAPNPMKKHGRGYGDSKIRSDPFTSLVIAIFVLAAMSLTMVVPSLNSQQRWEIVWFAFLWKLVLIHLSMLVTYYNDRIAVSSL
jgi:hypothetical protein